MHLVQCQQVTQGGVKSRREGCKYGVRWFSRRADLDQQGWVRDKKETRMLGRKIKGKKNVRKKKWYWEKR
jgi:hypothetical protein